MRQLAEHAPTASLHDAVLASSVLRLHNQTRLESTSPKELIGGISVSRSVHALIESYVTALRAKKAQAASAHHRFLESPEKIPAHRSGKDSAQALAEQALQEAQERSQRHAAGSFASAAAVTRAVGKFKRASVNAS